MCEGTSPQIMIKRERERGREREKKNGCVSECLYDVILMRRLWTVENDV